MVDVNTQNKTISVNVSSSGVSSNVNASSDTTLYYSNKAREWAISNRIVDGVDYSSKYYAGRANQSALNAQSFAQSAQDSYNNFQQSVDSALSNIDSSVQGGITTIDTKSSEAVENIGIEANKQIDNIERTGFYMRDDKLYFINSNGEEEEFKTNDNELNNPYSFGDSKYSPKPLNNLSWLKSEGQWNSKAVYPSYYDWALTNFNNGVEGFALSTGEYTDYDVVINTADETFRLPLLDGSESLPSNEYENTTFVKNAKGTYTYTAIKNGFFNLCEVGQSSSTSATRVILSRNGIKVDQHQDQGYAGSLHCFCKKGDEITVEVTVNTLSSTPFQNFIYAQGNGSLYYYVGETVQNTNLINAGRIGEKIASLIPDNSSLISEYGMSSGKSISLTPAASGTWYTAPTNGIVRAWGYKNTAQSTYINIYTDKGGAVGCYVPQNWEAPNLSIRVAKGEKFQVADYNDISDARLSFYYLKSEV